MQVVLAALVCVSLHPALGQQDTWRGDLDHLHTLTVTPQRHSSPLLHALASKWTKPSHAPVRTTSQGVPLS